MAGFIVDTEYTNRGLKGQFKQADRLKAKFTCVLNSEDLDNNEVKIKNNLTKEEEIINLDVLIYYLDEQLNTITNEDYEDGCGCGHHHEEEHECCGHCHHKEEE